MAKTFSQFKNGIISEEIISKHDVDVIRRIKPLFISTPTTILKKSKNLQVMIMSNISTQGSQINKLLNEHTTSDDLDAALDEILNVAINLCETYSGEYDYETNVIILTNDKTGYKVATAKYHPIKHFVTIILNDNMDHIEQILNVMTPEAAVGAAIAYLDDKLAVNEDIVGETPDSFESPVDTQNINPETTTDIEDKLNSEIEAETDVSKKELLINLKNFIPTIRKFAKGSYKNILTVLHNFITKGEEESKITPQDKVVMADIAFDLIGLILKNKSLLSIIGTEAKVGLNSEYRRFSDFILTENKKKPKIKKSKDKITPKLNMLLRLGLVPKELYTRAKRALTSKSPGSIPIYRNLLFDLLDEIVSYIEKDPTLYNRLRINVMKEMINSIPKKRMIHSAFTLGQKSKLESIEMPEDFNNDYILKSAWNRGFNSPPLEVDATIVVS